MVKSLEPAKERLPTAVEQRHQMRGAKEPVPLDLAKNLPVTYRQLQPDITGRTLETGKTGWGHPSILPRQEGDVINTEVRFCASRRFFARGVEQCALGLITHRVSHIDCSRDGVFDH